MKILKKAHISDSEYSHLNLELDPYCAGQMHQRHLAWGDEAQSIYIYQTAPDNVDHNTLSRYPVNWSALSQDESESTEHMDALEFFEGFPKAMGDPVEVWNSRIPLTIISILGTQPNGVMTYTKGSGSADPSADNDILHQEFPAIEEITVDADRHAEVIEHLRQLDPKMEAGNIGDYRLFDVTEYPEINVDQACQQFVAVWP